jgi:cell division transport system ATP-binding protein
VALSLTYGGARVVKADTKKWIHEILERLNLHHLKDSLGGQLSGGETQRVSMARALVRRPELIIADEPTGNQDQQNTWALMDLFQRANMNGTTILIATHDQEIIRRVPKRCAYLKSGRLHMEENQRAHSQISP